MSYKVIKTIKCKGRKGYGHVETGPRPVSTADVIGKFQL